jgi:hypothetical protein
VAIATVLALQLSGMTLASAGVQTDPVSPTTVAAAQSDAARAQAIADEAAIAAAKALTRLNDAKTAYEAEAKKAADAQAKAEATGKADDIKRAEEYAARAAKAAVKVAEAQVAYDAAAAKEAATAAAAATANTNAQREAASLAQLKDGTDTESDKTVPDTVMGLDDYIKSDNIEVVGNVRGVVNNKDYNCGALANNPVQCPSFAGLNFAHYPNLGYDFMFAVGTGGMSIWSLKDPAKPVHVAVVDLAMLNAASNTTMTKFWENENLTIDNRRMIAWMTRDASGTNGRGLFPIDISDPWNPKVMGYHKVPMGHTATCLNDCRYIWSVGGITVPTENPDGFRNKPSMVAVTDVRDPLHPYTYPAALAADVHRSGVVTGSTHSVDVDFDGVAWVSASRGVRGYWTQGKHYDAKLKAERWATPYDPISYGGGAVKGNDTSFMHNAYRFPSGLKGHDAGDLLLITNEANGGNCTTAGKFIIASIKGTRDAIDNVGTPSAPAKMDRVATYGPAGKPGVREGYDCSAHWFTVNGNIVAIGFYQQGVRFLDISDPANIQQVGHFRVPPKAATADSPAINANDSSAAYWHNGYVYVPDYGRGVDILKFNGDIPGKQTKKVCWNSCDK